VEKTTECFSRVYVVFCTQQTVEYVNTQLNCEHTAEIFAQDFKSKVDQIRSSSANAPAQLITDRSVHKPLTHLKPVTSEEVVKVLKEPAKQCSLDPVPTWLVKQLSSIFVPVIANMCNASFDQWTLPFDQKRAVESHRWT